MSRRFRRIFDLKRECLNTLFFVEVGGSKDCIIKEIK